MKVLVTGAKGQLGHDIMDELAKRNIEGIGVDVEEMDITDAETVRRVITESKADAVIHCAAFTDGGRERKKKWSSARKINGGGTENIAKVCGELGHQDDVYQHGLCV